MNATVVTAPFLLFAGEGYYPAPAWDEFRGAFVTQDEASHAVHEMRIPVRSDLKAQQWDESDPVTERIGWYQIVSLATLSVVECGGRGYGGAERVGLRDFKGYTLGEILS